MTAAQPIDLPPLPGAWGTMYSDSLQENDGYTADQMRGYAIDTVITLARQQHEPSGNAGEVAASDDVEMRLRAQAAIPFGPEGFDLIAEAAQHIAYLRAQLARQAAPHAQAEPVGYISEGTRAMLAAGCSTPITISISTGKAAVWCAPMYLSAPVPQEAEQKCTGCDPAEGFCKDCREAEQAAPAAVTATHGPVCLTNRKTADIATRGYNIVGYVLRSEDGAEVCISAESAVRWLPQANYWRLMHEQDGSLFAQPAAPAVTDAARDVLADAKGDA